MIVEKNVFKIGRLIKPHALKGEITFNFTNDVFDRVDCPYLVIEIEGILVPFFLEEYRFTTQDTALLKFEDYDSESSVRFLSGCDVFFPRSYYEEDNSTDNLDYSWNYFIGFKVQDEHAGYLGIIEQIDDSTLNTLFIVKDGNTEHLIPATDEFIKEVDSKNKIVYMSLIEGLIV